MKKDKYNPIEFLKMIRSCTYKFEHSTYEFQALVKEIDKFNLLKQFKEEDNNNYF